MHVGRATLLAAADVDAAPRALRDMIRRESLAGATAFVTHLAGAGGLREEVSIERAAEACWALVNSLLLHLLVATRGWSLQGVWRVAGSAGLHDAARAAGGTGGSRPALNIRTVHDATRERYEASVDGRVAGHLSYQGTKRLVVLTHTEVDPGLDDRGVADALVRRALDDLRADGARRVVPVCHYVAWWIGRHPDYATLVYDATAD